MARFGSVAELAAFLNTLDTEYAQYAAALWQKDIRTSQQLSNAREHILRSAGLSELHIDDIKARAGVRGEQLACKDFSLCANFGVSVILHTRPHTLIKAVVHTGTVQFLKPAVHVLCSLASSILLDTCGVKMICCCAINVKPTPSVQHHADLATLPLHVHLWCSSLTSLCAPTPLVWLCL